MHINLDKPIYDIDHESEVGQARKMIASALYKVQPRSQEGGEAYKQYRLAERIEQAEGEIELQAEEIAQIKDVIGRLYIPLIIGQLYDILEGKSEA
jgi:hypothetical protein